MVDESIFKLIKQLSSDCLGNLNKIYSNYSYDYDCCLGAKEYDDSIKKFASAERTVVWAETVIEYLSKPISVDIMKYVTEIEKGKWLKAAAQKVLSDKAENDKKERIRLAEKLDQEIISLLSKPHTIEWCKSVEKTYSEFLTVDLRARVLCKQADFLKTVYSDLGFIKQAIAIDDLISETYANGKDDTNFWNAVWYLKEEYDRLNSNVQKYCIGSVKLKEMIALVERQRKSVAEKLDAEYQRVKALPHAMDSVRQCRAYVSQWENSPRTVKEMCLIATEREIKSLVCLCNSEEEKLNEERVQAEYAAHLDRQISELSDAIFSNNVTPSTDCEDVFLKVDKIQTEFNNASAEVKALCKRKSELKNLIETTSRAHQEIAKRLEGEFENIRALPRSQKLIDEGRAFILKWNTTAISIKKFSSIITDNEIKRFGEVIDRQEEELKKDQSVRSMLWSATGRLAQEKDQARLGNVEADEDRTLVDAFNDCYDRAKRGDVNAMFELSKLYLAGTGVTKSYKDAFYWYDKATKEKEQERSNKLESDKKCKPLKDEDRSEKEREFVYTFNDRYDRANRGNVIAMYELAELYFTGTGVTKSYKDAFHWYEKAAKNGHADAMKKLGDCYFYGYGVSKSASKAERYYKKALKTKK